MNKKKHALLVVMLLLLIASIFLILLARNRQKPEDEIRNGEPLRSGILIDVYIHKDDIVREMDMEEYLLGVVAAEMPAYFEMEALKAQAVAARTYAYGRMIKEYNSSGGRHPDADICTNPAHCQAWTDKASASRRWGIFFSYDNWERICNAVRETKNLIIIYDGKVANPLYHSNSGGRTENAEDIWEGTVVEYLKSSDSYGDEYSPEYRSEVRVSFADFAEKIGLRYAKFDNGSFDPFQDVAVLNLTEGGSVGRIAVGNLILKGTELRTIFGLRSAKFSVETDENGHFVFTVLGYGHGVGMSQWGANYLAKCGETYEDILKYYYRGVTIIPIR